MSYAAKRENKTIEESRAEDKQYGREEQDINQGASHRLFCEYFFPSVHRPTTYTLTVDNLFSCISIIGKFSSHFKDGTKWVLIVQRRRYRYVSYSRFHYFAPVQGSPEKKNNFLLVAIKPVYALQVKN